MANVHDGHRARVRKRVEAEGLTNFEPHEVLELLLFYCIPKGDVNPAAHELVNRFGSVRGVLNAPEGELMKVSGVGEVTARWLRSLPAILEHYVSLRLEDRPRLSRVVDAQAYAKKLFQAHTPQEQLWVASMNQQGYLLHCAMVESGEKVYTPDIRALMSFALRYQAQSLLILQQRTPAGMVPEDEEAVFVRKLVAGLYPVGIRLVDNVLICGDARFSFYEKRLMEYPGSVLESAGMELHRHWLDG